MKNGLTSIEKHGIFRTRNFDYTLPNSSLKNQNSETEVFSADVYITTVESYLTVQPNLWEEIHFEKFRIFFFTFGRRYIMCTGIQ